MYILAWSLCFLYYLLCLSQLLFRLRSWSARLFLILLIFKVIDLNIGIFWLIPLFVTATTSITTYLRLIISCKPYHFILTMGAFLLNILKTSSLLLRLFIISLTLNLYHRRSFLLLFHPLHFLLQSFVLLILSIQLSFIFTLLLAHLLSQSLNLYLCFFLFRSLLLVVDILVIIKLILNIVIVLFVLIS